ncbi:MAG: ferritin-like domain-containing protein [Spirochaetota bacterium]
MKFKNLQEIIKFAIEKEKEAARLYDEASLMEESASVKKTFQELAGEERKHRKLLENMEKEGLEKSLSSYTIKWINNMRRSDYLVDIKYEKGMPYRDILILAMKREEKSFKLYNDLLKQSTVESHKKLFSLLSQEEAKHKLKLETIYDDYMAKMGD